AEGSYTYNVKPGELYKAVTPTTVAANVIVTGEVYSKDLSLAFRQDFAAKTIKKLDLSGVKIVADVLTPTSDDDKIADYIPSNLLYNPNATNPVKPIVEEILLPNSVTRIAQAAFSNCYKLKDIRLPESLIPDRIVVGYYGSGNPKYGYAIGSQAFSGCTSLTTIYIPGPVKTVNGRQVVCHFDPSATYFPDSDQSSMYNLGHKVGDRYDASQTTIVVPDDYINVYRTAYSDMNFGNPWQKLGYNIVSENPVYGVEFDASRITTTEPDYDITSMASFLGENVALTSLNVEKKLKLINPSVEALVFDNGNRIYPDAEGYISVEFFNPAKSTTGVGNHRISVINTYDVAFNTTSPLFTISEPEVSNNSEYKSGEFDRTEALAPVLRNVAENSTVRFRLDYTTEHADKIDTHLLVGQQELTPDADGVYTVDI
ncbi:MAG: leucine-rich repeat domain-containing protein, partial [Muribaculaceae bacterium]|nr:leucine-rich repeat domain-containing protein [Muribaculaceae bacterium]